MLLPRFKTHLCLRLPTSTILIQLDLATPNHQIRVDEVPSIRATVHPTVYHEKEGAFTSTQPFFSRIITRAARLSQRHCCLATGLPFVEETPRPHRNVAPSLTVEIESLDNAIYHCEPRQRLLGIARDNSSDITPRARSFGNAAVRNSRHRTLARYKRKAGE